MEPLIIALISAAALGGVMLISAFIRQIMLSHDKKLNDEAQSRALAQEAAELEKIRMQMQSDTRYNTHYQILGKNKEEVNDIGLQIEKVLDKKMDLIERYATASFKESGDIIKKGEVSIERKAIYDRLRKEIDSKLAFYDSELKCLQKRRADLWDAHTRFETHLLCQEKSRNDHIDGVFKQHSAILEKVYLRHIEHTEVFAVKSVDASTASFIDMLMMPINFLTQFFRGGAGFMPNISLVHTRVEHSSRMNVDRAEREMNNPQSYHVENDMENETYTEAYFTL